MKKQFLFLKSKVVLGLFSVSLLLTLTLSSCNNPNSEDTKEIAEDQNEAKFNNSKEDDAEFLVNAAEINLEEIQLGKLAQINSMNDEVKSFGKMMETEHTMAQSNLQELAAKKQITIPTTLTENGQEANNKLMDNKGTDFDKEYVDMLIDGHQDAISKFEKASTDANDTEIRSWALSMIPTLRKHLYNFITYQKQTEKM